MENSRFVIRAGVDGNPNLAAGILLSTSLLGLVTYIWAFWCQRHHVKKIRGPLISLICVDITNVIAGIIMGSGFIGSISDSVIFSHSVPTWLLTRSYGVILHLLASYWCLLCLNQPQQKAKQHYIFAVVFMLICALTPVYVFVEIVAIYILGFITTGLALGVIANFRVSVRSPSAAKEKKLIMSLAMCIFWVVFFPSFVLLLASVSYNIGRIYMNVLFFTNIHLFLNGWLCFSILKLSTAAEENEQQQQRQQPQWQQPPPPHQWQQPPQHQWQQPPPQGLENPGYDVSVFTVAKGQNSN